MTEEDAEPQGVQSESSPQTLPQARPDSQPVPRTLAMWTLIGLAPSFLHGVALMFTSFGQYGAPVGSVGGYVLAMPLFALAYLIVIALASNRFAKGGGLRRLGFVVGYQFLNMLLWVGGCLTAMGEIF